jgi:hypothetical protein
MSKATMLRTGKFLWAGAFALLTLTATAKAHPVWEGLPQSPDGGAQFVERDDDGDWQSDREQEQQDRELEKRDREQEKLDREQEKRDRVQEQADRLEELYDDGREALDEERYDEARDKFSQLAKAAGAQADAALYWEAYAEQRLGRRQEALAAIAEPLAERRERARNRSAAEQRAASAAGSAEQ